jgi:hypothetical protein
MKGQPSNIRSYRTKLGLLKVIRGRDCWLGSLEEVLSSYVQRTAEKLRAKKMLAGVVQVFAETIRFHPELQYTGNGSKTLAVPTAYMSILHAQALCTLPRIYCEGFRYQKVGVMFLELVQDKPNLRKLLIE